MVETNAEGARKALVVHEPMFGCTEKIARAVAQGLEAEGVAVEVFDVRDAGPAHEATYDLLVVGAPTHAFSLSRPSTRANAVRQGAPVEVATTGLREWLASMGPQDEPLRRPAAAFDTRVTKVRRIPKAASTRASRLLVRHGYTLVSRPTPFLVTDTRGPLVDGELERAVVWGRLVALAVRRRQGHRDQAQAS